MPDPLRISVVVASRARPEMLLRCLQSLDQLIWPNFEVIVVADKSGRDAVATRHKGAPEVKLIGCDQANIALSRNLGVAKAGGDVVAFIDDDAVAEPMWLAAIAATFADGAVGAVTGPILGRNGISIQYGAETVLSSGETVPAENDPTRRRASGNRTPKTVGTNMAFRSDLIRTVGGFDESYRYLFEDADLNMRLGSMGVVTAYEPEAVVHHSSAPSKRRRRDRAPRDLFDIGRSTAIFLARHCPSSPEKALAAARQREFARVDRSLIEGRLEPRDARQLRKSFDEGVAKAKLKDMEPRFHQFGARPDFEPRLKRSWHHAKIGSGLRHRRGALKAARAERDKGSIVSLVILSRTSLYHKVVYDHGIWVQRGGVYGRSDRGGPILQMKTRQRRFETEIARVSGVRGLNQSIDASILADCDVTEASVSFF